MGSKLDVDTVKKLIIQHVTVIDLGACSHFLGINIYQRDNGLFLSQEAYTRHVLEVTNMLDCKPSSTPMPMDHPLYLERKPATKVERQEMTRFHYHLVLGSLLYLITRTRPEISTPVSML